MENTQLNLIPNEESNVNHTNTDSDNPPDNRSSKTATNDNEKTYTEKYVKKLRNESAKYRVALKELKEAYEDFPVDKLQEYKNYPERISELQEVIARYEKSEKEREVFDKADKLQSLLIKTAAAHNAVDPRQVARLLKDNIDIDDEGNPFVIDKDNITIDEFVSGYLQSNMHLVRSKSNKKGANTTPHITDMLAIEQVSAMTADQYALNRDKILKYLQEKSLSNA